MTVQTLGRSYLMTISTTETKVIDSQTSMRKREHCTMGTILLKLKGIYKT